MYVVTVVTKQEDQAGVAAAYVFDTEKEALEKYYYELNYALNQDIPYVMALITNEHGCNIRTEVC